MIDVELVQRGADPYADAEVTTAILQERGEQVDAFAGDIASADIKVGAEATDVRAVTVQLFNSKGEKTGREAVTLLVLADGLGDAFSTGGSTGLASAGADWLLQTESTKKVFSAITDDDGYLSLTWTDTGTAAARLAVVLPNGKLSIGPVMTNA